MSELNLPHSGLTVEQFLQVVHMDQTRVGTVDRAKIEELMGIDEIDALAAEIEARPIGRGTIIRGT